MADGAIDIEKLRQLLGQDAATGAERFGLFWPGKGQAIRAAQLPSTATLLPVPEQSKNWDETGNVFIEGDNLEVLKTLQRHYAGKVKLIYIDPPYNTGKDFVYQDKYQEGLKTYLEWTQQVNTEGQRTSPNSETAGRYHSNWLNMMYPRLKLARNLLAEDGVIFISIDDNEIDNLLHLGKEIFGENNYLASFIWKSKSGGANDSGGAAIDHEYLVCFSKNKIDSALGLDPDAVASTSYNNEDEQGLYSLERLDKQSLGYQPSLDFPIYAPDGTCYTVQQRNPSIPNARWRWSKETVEQRHNELVFKDGNVYTKNYEKQGGKPRSLFVEERFGRTRTGSTELRELLKGAYFDNPKPSKLIKTITAIGATPDSLILDFFAGSATTAHAVMQLNAEDGGQRRFILVQLPEPTPADSEARKAGFATIADISRRRIELAGEKIKTDMGEKAAALDVGFRAYQLADTQFAKWRVGSDTTPEALQQNLFAQRNGADDAASSAALLTEVLLKMGYALNERMTSRNIEGLAWQQVGSVGAALPPLLAYMDEHHAPSLAQLRAAIDTAVTNTSAPMRIVVLEDAFGGDDALKTNALEYAKAQGVELKTA